jgi:glycosyltransferase involved in cell wall biosynthesis
MSAPLITAIICTRNRARLLDLCLRSVLRQTVPRGQYEVLVVDNGSSDDTPAVCAGHAAAGVRCIVEPVAGLSRARNTGWREAQGPVVGYLDDDGQATEGWLAGALSAFHDVQPVPAWAGGPIDLDWHARPPAWLDAPLQECLGVLDLGDRPRWLAPHERLGGGNSFFPRALLAELGGFDERLGRVNNLLLSGEETQLQRRIEAHGGRLYYHPDIRMRHDVPVERVQPSFFYRRYYWGGITDAVIRRTLREQAPIVSGMPLPTAHAQASLSATARLGRLLKNMLAAAGCAAQPERIRGRIYLAYVCGALRGRWLRAAPSSIS